MMNRKLVLAACIVGMVAAVMTVSSDAYAMRIANRLTFSRAVSLPGVVLPAGTYTFESAPAGSRPELVRVLDSRDKIMFLGFTQVGRRPFNIPATQVITLEEVPAGQPAPIRAWYPAGMSVSHEFNW